MVIMHKLTLDVASDGIQGNLVLVRGERGKRDIAVTLRCGKVPIVLEAGQTAAIVGVKPDGGELLNSCVVYTENGIYPNTILYHVTEGTVAAAGTFSVRLAVWDVEGNILYSPEFSITVKDNDALDLAVGARSEFTALIDAAAQAQRAAAEAEQTADEIGGLLEKHTAEADDKYVPRVKHGHSQNEVLVEDSEGEILSVELSYGAEPDSVPRRKKVTGALKVGDPVEDDDAISLGFAKKNFAGGASSEDVFQKTANALIGEKTGEIIAIGDASPVEHELKVNVKRKNLCNLGTVEVTNSYIDKQLDTPLKAGVYCVSMIATSSDTDAERCHVLFLGGGKQNKSISMYRGIKHSEVLTFSIDIDEIRFYASSSYNSGVGDTATFTDIQIEEGTTATAYTPYIEDLSAVKVKKCGKNLLKPDNQATTKTINGVTFTRNQDGTILVNGTATAKTSYFFYDYDSDKSPFMVTDTNIDLYMSGCPTGGDNSSYYLFSTWVGAKDTGKGISLPKVNNRTRKISIIVNSGVTMDNVLFKPQIEVGTVATEYEQYIEPITHFVNADGTAEGVTSLSPNITLITDTEGTIIHCKYNRDINKAFAELQQAIISLGGNI